jgi:hypothetical protein
MNDFHMTSLASSRIAERRAEADRSRLARTADSEATTRRSSGRPHRRDHGTRASLATFFGRVAIF